MEQKLRHFFETLDSAQEKTLFLFNRQEPVGNVCSDEAVNCLKKALKLREEILTEAQQQGKKADSIAEVIEILFPKHQEWRLKLESSRQKIRQIRFLALAHLTVSHKSLSHIGQILELIETRGLGKTTYHKTKCSTSGGGFVDKVA